MSNLDLEIRHLGEVAIVAVTSIVLVSGLTPDQAARAEKVLSDYCDPWDANGVHYDSYGEAKAYVDGLDNLCLKGMKWVPLPGKTPEELDRELLLAAQVIVRQALAFVPPSDEDEGED